MENSLILAKQDEFKKLVAVSRLCVLIWKYNVLVCACNILYLSWHIQAWPDLLSSLWLIHCILLFVLSRIAWKMDQSIENYCLIGRPQGNEKTAIIMLFEQRSRYRDIYKIATLLTIFVFPTAIVIYHHDFNHLSMAVVWFIWVFSIFIEERKNWTIHKFPNMFSNILIDMNFLMEIDPLKNPQRNV